MSFSSLCACLLALGCSDSSSGVTSGYVNVDGGRLYYEEAGEGTPLVMIHGGFLDRRMWDGQFEAFARNYRAIRYDVRAHGLSRADSVPFADYEDLRHLMDSLGVNRAIVMGLSLGGQIAIDFAITNPERVRALVLAGPGMSGWNFDDSEEIATYTEEMMAAAQTGDFGALIEVFAQWWCDGPQREPEQVDSVVRRRVLDMLGGSRQRWELSPLVQVMDPPAVERLDEIRVPTLAVAGGIDVPIIHEIVERIVEQVPGAERVVIPGVAHMVNMERPETFGEVVGEFLSRLPGQ
jgi:3-oxoadipate enol-lactonase